MPTMSVVLTTSYNQLSVTERAFVDAAVTHIERAAQKAKEPISHAIGRALPSEVVEASRGMLDKPLVLSALTERINAIAAEQELTSARLVRETMAIATANIGNYISYDPDGNPYFTLMNCSRDELAAIKNIEIETSGKWAEGKTKIKLTFHEKLAAIKLAGEHIGLWNVDNPHYKATQQAAAAIGADSTPHAAGEAYQRYLTGGA